MNIPLGKAAGAHGVVASHPIRMRKALGSIPSVSIPASIPACCNTSRVLATRNAKFHAIRCPPVSEPANTALPSMWKTQNNAPREARTPDLEVDSLKLWKPCRSFKITFNGSVQAPSASSEKKMKKSRHHVRQKTAVTQVWYVESCVTLETLVVNLLSNRRFILQSELANQNGPCYGACVPKFL